MAGGVVKLKWMLSARSQVQGIVKEIELGNVMADVVVAGGAVEFVAAM